MLIALGSMTFLAACPGTDDAVGLEALRVPLVDVGRNVQRVDDPALVSSYRVLAATWQAAIGN